ncbi:hypothetical protein EVAR_92443_1 [Eumeta japonica]|uniref:Uncharacterized protein n=1 Tax=Eumeta variegata TaxID=151549 RepID=A0A4C1T8S5_EUMVA|nr:hypothetical protein EVAR_92443_1 [Eumeta japonica]
MKVDSGSARVSQRCDRNPTGRNIIQLVRPMRSQIPVGPSSERRFGTTSPSARACRPFDGCSPVGSLKIRPRRGRPGSRGPDEGRRRGRAATGRGGPPGPAAVQPVDSIIGP